MKLSLKNMVCNRCVMVVEKQLIEMGFTPVSVELGEVDLGEQEFTTSQIEEVNSAMRLLGFELLDDKSSKLIEKTKLLLIDYVENHLSDEYKVNISDYLGSLLNYDYSYLSNLFSALSGITIEHFLIQLKIEKVKELLIYNEFTLSEISYQLGYSSVAHLSGQFKRVTGFTPSEFKKEKENRIRLSLDKLGIT
ncbi:MAG: helix-turn-helix domain-containing protein [Salibacteraceae bacterium]